MFASQTDVPLTCKATEATISESAQDCYPVYSYLPPGQAFRILQLLPAPDLSDPLFGRLIVAEFQNAPTYEALSYVWGQDPERTVLVTIGEQPVRIMVNLKIALQYLRYRDSPRLLWVDAL